MDVFKCRICGYGKVVSLGKIPDCGEFAGQPVSPSIKGGDLWKCKSCDSLFRYPSLSEKDYLEYYQKASGTIWVDDKTWRNDFALIYAYLKNCRGSSILDIGCYVGKFLDEIPDGFHKFGLEPSTRAAECAALKGITILGKTLTDLEPLATFDVVVAIDVIEHVLDVEAFMMDALKHVGRDGLLIISTGNPDCIFWNRIFRARFWYSSFSEHVVFPSLRYFCGLSDRLNLIQPEQKRFKYANNNLLTSMRGFLRQVFFAVSPLIYRKAVSLYYKIRGRTALQVSEIPLFAAGVFVDHQLVIFRNTRRE